MSDERCKACGYSKQDAQINMDHGLCKNAGNAPWETSNKTSESDSSKYDEGLWAIYKKYNPKAYRPQWENEQTLYQIITSLDTLLGKYRIALEKYADKNNWQVAGTYHGKSAIYIWYGWAHGIDEDPWEIATEALDHK